MRPFEANFKSNNNTKIKDQACGSDKENFDSTGTKFSFEFSNESAKNKRIIDLKDESPIPQKKVCGDDPKVAETKYKIQPESLEVYPGEPAYPDNQGNHNTCTPHALSKATVDGYEDGIFLPGKMDFKQEETTKKLINMHPDGENMKGVWPNKYDNKIVTLTDQKNLKIWDVTMNVTGITNDELINGDVKQKKEDGSWCSKKRENNYVMIHKLHNVYIHHVFSHVPYDGKTFYMAWCMNSHPNDPRPVIDVDEPGLQFYEVRCSAVELFQLSEKNEGVSDPTRNSSEENFIKADDDDDDKGISEVPKGGGYPYEDNEKESELVALSKAISETESVKKSTKHTYDHFLTKLKSMTTQKKELLKRFNDTEINDVVWPQWKKTLKIHVEEMTLEEILIKNPKHTSSCKYILHYPVDFAKPDGIKRFKYVPEVFEKEGYTIAYCEKIQDDERAEFINLARKGNKFFKITTTLNDSEIGADTEDIWKFWMTQEASGSFSNFPSFSSPSNQVPDDNNVVKNQQHQEKTTIISFNSCQDPDTSVSMTER